MAEAINWINRGRHGCKGNTMTLPEANGTVLRTTCDKCALNWTRPARSVVEG